MIQKFALALFILCNFQIAESRIRLRKVKEAPKTCSFMKEDSLLSRPIKPVWSTERHSIVVADDITLVNDLGQKVCSWDRKVFAEFGDITKFHFYIDEFKENIYPYIDNKESGFLVLKAPFKQCSFSEKTIVPSLSFPKCEKAKKVARRKKKKVSV